MNTGDTVKFVYVNTGTMPATPAGDTIYFNPITKTISVGGVNFVALPAVTTADAGSTLKVDASGNWVVSNS